MYQLQEVSGIYQSGSGVTVRRCVLPTELLGVLQVSLGDKLAVDVRDDGVLLQDKRPALSPNDLVAQCVSTAP